MANPKALKDLLVKVKRAYQHILDLNREIAKFIPPEGSAYKIVPEDDLQTGERTFYLHILEEMPSEFSALIGDILHNLRSALDHLAWHLVSISPVKKKTKRVYFPIFETSGEYHTGKMGKVQGMTGLAINAIDAIEPYYRIDGVSNRIGNGIHLWWLHTMNIRDKHTLLIPVWANPVGHTLTKSQRIELAPVLEKAFPYGIPDDLIIAASPESKIVQDGSKLYTFPISEVDDDMQFKVHIAFGEPEGVRGKEVVSTLLAMHKIVRQTILDFDGKGLL
jgi:hypothetical protein